MEEKTLTLLKSRIQTRTLTELVLTDPQSNPVQAIDTGTLPVSITVEST